jgi:hypothetical protein
MGIKLTYLAPLIGATAAAQRSSPHQLPRQIPGRPAPPTDREASASRPAMRRSTTPLRPSTSIPTAATHSCSEAAAIASGGRWRPRSPEDMRYLGM